MRAASKIASVIGNTFTDSGLNPTTAYVYSVRGAQGTTPQITATPGGTTTTTSSTVSTTPSTPIPPVPGAPSNLHETGHTASTVTLSWSGAAGGVYDVLRGEAGDKIATVTGNTFTDIGLLAHTPYVYSVRSGGVTTPQITVTIS